MCQVSVHSHEPTVGNVRDKNENVINQGLYYMKWLLDHRSDFVVAAHDVLGSDTGSTGAIHVSLSSRKIMQSGIPMRLIV